MPNDNEYRIHIVFTTAKGERESRWWRIDRALTELSLMVQEACRIAYKGTFSAQEQDAAEAAAESFREGLVQALQEKWEQAARAEGAAQELERLARFLQQ